MKDSKEIIETIKNLRKKKGLSLQELANRVGVSKSTLSRYESLTREFPINDVGIYADVLNVSVEHLLGIDSISNVTPVNKFIEVPILGKIACGDPIDAEENIKGYTYELQDTLPVGEYLCLETTGDSMQPTIPEGSNVIIRKQPDVENGEIAAVLLNGDTEATLKRVKKQKDSLVLIPDNPEHDPFIVNEEHPAKIIGKAVKLTQNL